MLGLSRREWAWAGYDWANSAFATTVLAGLFPVFYKTFWHAGVPVETSTFHLGLLNSIASLLIAVAAPLLGAIADGLGRRKGGLLLFAALGILATGALYWIERGDWLSASFLFLAGVIGFSGSNIFYDALLILIAPRRHLNRLSSIGFALGYLGGGLLFAVQVWMIRDPGRFGLIDATQAVQIAFLSVAAWWALFTLPLVLWVREPTARRETAATAPPIASWRQVLRTLRNIRALPEAFTFLLAYWLYIDGVDTVIRMAVDYGLSLGFPQTSLITALLITQFVGFPAALVFGRLGSRFGAKRAILAGLAAYMAITGWGALMTSVEEFYALAIAVGLVQGGVQALSRAQFSRLIPGEQSAEFFGFYNLLGKFAAVLGPLLVGGVTLLTQNPRFGILSVLILFVLGGLLLLRVDTERGEQRVHQQPAT